LLRTRRIAARKLRIAERMAHREEPVWRLGVVEFRLRSSAVSAADGRGSPFRGVGLEERFGRGRRSG
jgi:hypothetical protein